MEQGRDLILVSLTHRGEVAALRYMAPDLQSQDLFRRPAQSRGWFHLCMEMTSFSLKVDKTRLQRQLAMPLARQKCLLPLS